LREGFITSIRWKGENGWLDLTIDNALTLSSVIANHVNNSFIKESQLNDQIDSLYLSENRQGLIDLTW